MQKVFDKRGNEKGILRSIDDIPDKFRKNTLEPFVRSGCCIYEDSMGEFNAIPTSSVNIKEVGNN